MWPLRLVRFAIVAQCIARISAQQDMSSESSLETWKIDTHNVTSTGHPGNPNTPLYISPTSAGQSRYEPVVGNRVFPRTITSYSTTIITQTADCGCDMPRSSSEPNALSATPSSSRAVSSLHFSTPQQPVSTALIHDSIGSYISATASSSRVISSLHISTPQQPVYTPSPHESIGPYTLTLPTPTVLPPPILSVPSPWRSTTTLSSARFAANNTQWPITPTISRTTIYLTEMATITSTKTIMNSLRGGVTTDTTTATVTTDDLDLDLFITVFETIEAYNTITLTETTTTTETTSIGTETITHTMAPPATTVISTLPAKTATINNEVSGFERTIMVTKTESAYAIPSTELAESTVSPKIIVYNETSATRTETITISNSPVTTTIIQDHTSTITKTVSVSNPPIIDLSTKEHTVTLAVTEKTTLPGLAYTVDRTQTVSELVTITDFTTINGTPTAITKTVTDMHLITLPSATVTDYVTETPTMKANTSAAPTEIDTVTAATTEAIASPVSSMTMDTVNPTSLMEETSVGSVVTEFETVSATMTKQTTIPEFSTITDAIISIEQTSVGPTVTGPDSTIATTAEVTAIPVLSTIVRDASELSITVTQLGGGNSQGVSAITITEDLTLASTATATASSSITLCTSRIVNPTYTPAAALPRNYTWGCPPGTLCHPSQVDCNFEVGPPADSYYCSPDECISSPKLLPPQSWGPAVTSDESEHFDVSPGYFNLDPREFNLTYGVFDFPSGIQLGNAMSKVRRSFTSLFGGGIENIPRALSSGGDTHAIPGVCYDECNDCMLEAESEGKTPALCAAGSAFEEFLGYCNSCIDLHSRGGGSSSIPPFQQFLSYCDTMGSGSGDGSSSSQSEDSSSSTSSSTSSTSSNTTEDSQITTTNDTSSSDSSFSKGPVGVDPVTASVTPSVTVAASDSSQATTRIASDISQSLLTDSALTTGSSSPSSEISLPNSMTPSSSIKSTGSSFSVGESPVGPTETARPEPEDVSPVVTCADGSVVTSTCSNGPMATSTLTRSSQSGASAGPSSGTGNSGGSNGYTIPYINSSSSSSSSLTGTFTGGGSRQHELDTRFLMAGLLSLLTVQFWDGFSLLLF